MQNTNKKKKRRRRKSLMPSGIYGLLLILMGLVAVAFLAVMAMMNAFPARIAAAVIVLMLAILIGVRFLMTRDGKGPRIVGVLIALVFLGAYGVGAYYLGSTYAAFAKMSNAGGGQTNTSQLDVTSEPFNVYITGIDMWNKEKGLDLERSDVNMIVTVNPQTRKILLTSIPRDTYVMLHTAQQMDKLTHTGVYGVDETLNTVEDWLGFDMDYYLKVNFTSVVKVIDTIGRIDVYSPVAFDSSISDYSYKKGWNHLSGRQALFFARERKAFEGKDSIRVENQQRVMKAVLDKLLSSKTLLTKYPEMLEAGADDMETNMPVRDMQALVKMQMDDMRSWDIESQKIKGDYDMDYVASLTQNQKFQVYKAYPGSITKVQAYIRSVMNPTSEELREAEKARKKSFFDNFFKKFTGDGDDEEADGSGEQ